MSRRKKIAVLGSTGSIGVNTLDILARDSDRFEVTGLAAGSNISLLLRQVEAFRPKIVSVRSRHDAMELKKALKTDKPAVVFGPEGAEEVASFPGNDIIVSAITGIVGLRPTLAAVKTGCRVALANKESMVVAGAILQREAAKSGARFIPVDSEHSGIFQCLAKERLEDVSRVVLTASGGPFFRTPLAEMGEKTVEETLAHPRWKMGKKVTVDSATMMNKGLELIEARWLFDIDPRKLGILIHPQSIVHSLVELRNGSVLAQLSPTDMKIPIHYALTYPRRGDSPSAALDLASIRVLEFFEVEEVRYPLIRVARRALEEGKSFPVVLNAANETAVSAFLDRRISFSGISRVVSDILERHRPADGRSLEEIFEIDRRTRKQTEDYIKHMS